MPARRKPTTAASRTAAEADVLNHHRRASGGVLIFDGDCGFCTASANRARGILPGTVSVAPWQSLDLDQLGLTVAQVSSAAYFVDESGAQFRGHAAVGRALEIGTRPLRPIGWLLRRPPVAWLAAPLYGLISKYRYRLPGSTDSCRL